ncbi:hypothetical protein Zm00014a_027180 [Zea mays]|uniref:E2F-associated phosphoprotein n=3 Tax=Zea mays TaxID=4577 RepID=A0AAJ8WYH4_MAIZE|nr:E2F-associated phosphoprotein [Zea mays]XP_020394207.1 E2F-associated phosphoprotein isoform X1 [Zea mays]AQK72960.1 hypothetical protein ZEAMMB73_Zm00001d017351 [Zea mays]PWZ24259.1 E2F-associated phosphoprotein [Zea mays]PWZ24260.1 hypothetical protein Zm00014a_027180 [Zea mays]|eukprot:NP_001338681.1 E2F-associated phosphoprotein [Zea mays]
MRRNISRRFGPVSAHLWRMKDRESEKGQNRREQEDGERRRGGMEPDKAGEAAKEPTETEAGDSVDPRELVSSDDEIDYSVEPDFYDPDLDDVDERWVSRQRKGRTSDAVLSCPACFTTLCLDCQRHEKYVNQYRAMFVRNCKIKTDQVLREGKSKRKKRRGGRAGDPAAASEGESKGQSYHPVCCEVCSTEVGVLDEDEVYHFFNVIPSNS